MTEQKMTEADQRLQLAIANVAVKLTSDRGFDPFGVSLALLAVAVLRLRHTLGEEGLSQHLGLIAATLHVESGGDIEERVVIEGEHPMNPTPAGKQN